MRWTSLYDIQLRNGIDDYELRQDGGEMPTATIASFRIVRIADSICGQENSLGQSVLHCNAYPRAYVFTEQTTPDLGMALPGNHLRQLKGNENAHFLKEKESKSVFVHAITN